MNESFTKGVFMKKVLVLCCLLLGLPLAAQADNEKIAPDSFICAELVTAPMTDGGQPPIFEALQIDGYVSAGLGDTVAHPEVMAPILTEVYTYCQTKPTEKVADVWAKARKQLDTPAKGTWQADKTTCKDYNDDPDNGSGFVIWLDGYNRGKNKSKASILENDDTLNAFLGACAKQPNELMLDVLAKNAK